MIELPEAFILAKQVEETVTNIGALCIGADVRRIILLSKGGRRNIILLYGRKEQTFTIVKGV